MLVLALEQGSVLAQELELVLLAQDLGMVVLAREVEEALAQEMG